MTERPAAAASVRGSRARRAPVVHEGESISLEEFQDTYSRGAPLRYVGLSGRPDATQVPREEPGVGPGGVPTTRLTIGEMAGLSRAQLRRLLTDEIGSILGVAADTTPFPV